MKKGEALYRAQKYVRVGKRLARTGSAARAEYEPLEIRFIVWGEVPFRVKRVWVVVNRRVIGEPLGSGH